MLPAHFPSLSCSFRASLSLLLPCFLSRAISLTKMLALLTTPPNESPAFIPATAQALPHKSPVITKHGALTPLPCVHTSDVCNENKSQCLPQTARPQICVPPPHHPSVCSLNLSNSLPPQSLHLEHKLPALCKARPHIMRLSAQMAPPQRGSHPLPLLPSIPLKS